MAVYTKVSKVGIQSILSKYDVGKLIKYEEIQEGIENSNFKVTTTDGTFILTIYEKRVKEEDLPYFINLMSHLSGNGINCPKPIKDKSGEIFQKISNKKSILVTFLSGNSLKFIDKSHCYELGKNLANFHIKGLKFKGKRENDLNYRSWIKLFRKGIARNDLYKKSLLNEIEKIIKETVDHWPSDLEIGHIHADLFPNNVFFTNNKLSGIIDFYFACYDILAYDIAICINSWCFKWIYSWSDGFCALQSHSSSWANSCSRIDLVPDGLAAAGGVAKPACSCNPPHPRSIVDWIWPRFSQ